MVLHAFFGDCVLWLFHVLSLWTWCCIHSLEIVFSDCSNSSMEFYRTSLCERHSTASSTKESFGRSLKWMQRCLESNTRDIFLLWIWSCIDSLEIVFCDCSMLCRGCPWTWNGCIENWVLVSVEVACDCKDWFVFSMIIQNFWTSAEDGWLIAPALAMCGARLLWLKWEWWWQSRCTFLKLCLCCMGWGDCSGFASSCVQCCGFCSWWTTWKWQRLTVNMLASEHYLHAKCLVQVAHPWHFWKHCGYCFIFWRDCPWEWSSLNSCRPLSR